MSPHDRAQSGLREIEDAVVDLLTQHQDWMSRADIARALDIELSYQGHNGYFSGCLCERLEGMGRIEVHPDRRPETRYRLKPVSS